MTRIQNIREGRETYGRLDHLVGPGGIVDVDGYAAEGGDLGGELVEAGIVLAFALVGFGHFGVFVRLVARRGWEGGG